MTSHETLKPADELFSWSAVIQRVDHTVDRQTQACNLIFKGPLQTLLICRAKRLIRQGSERQTCGVVTATSRTSHTYGTSLSWRALPAWGDYIREFCSSWQLPHRCFSSTQLWNITVALHPTVEKWRIYPQTKKMHSGIFWKYQTLSGVLHRFLFLINVFLVTDTDRKGTAFT